MALPLLGGQMGYAGAGGKRFMSSVLAKASQPGGYQKVTTYGAGGNPNYRGPSFGSGYGQAFAANKARATKIEGMYDQMLKAAGPGGAFEKRGLHALEQIRGKGIQQRIGQGMANVTAADPTVEGRLTLEDLMQQRQMGIMQQKAGFLERIEDSYPDYSSLFSMLSR